ncbi:MAG: hypothetical protein ACI4XR_04555 [Bacilli bacterium]
MKLFRMSKTISVFCSLLGLILSLYGLIISLLSIRASGMERLGVIFIIPSVIALIIIVLDFFITIGKIKKGLIYSFITSLIKIGIIILIIPGTIYDLKYEIQYGISNLKFDLTLIFLFVIVTIPSILNTINLISLRKKQ